MGAFGSKVAAAKITGGGTNIRDGKYTFMVERCHFHTGHKNSAFIAELRVMKADANGEYEIAQDGKTTTDKLVTPNPVGTSCSFVASWEFESGPGNAKKFVLGVLEGFGYKEEQITEQVLDGVIDAKNPLHGMLVQCETYRDVNKGKKTPENRGKILVLQNWKGIAQTKEDLAKQRQWLAANKVAKTEPAAPSAPAAAPSAPAAAPSAPAAAPAAPAVTAPAAPAVATPADTLAGLEDLI